MNVQLVVFDMAGTTVYDGDAVNVCLRRALQAAGVETTRDAVNAVMGIAKPVAIRSLLETYASPLATTDRVDAIHEDFLARMLAYYHSDPTVREIEGATDLFRTLRRSGVKVALDTGFSRPVVEAILLRLGWRSSALMDATVSSDEVVNGRPAPDMIYRAMQLTGVTDASRVAKFGDTPSDLQEGQAAGCGWIIGVTEGSHTHKELSPYLHTHLVRTVTEVLSCLF